MPRGRVVVIENDEWISTLLAKFLGDVGYEVEVATEARTGFDRVRASVPDCVLCDVNLPDIDGFWVARRVRAEPPPVGLTPFLFLTDAEDLEGRLQGLNVGADLFLNMPFRAEEVVAQVSALIDMANRLKQGSPSSQPPSSGRSPTAFKGDVAQLSVSTVLTLLELERRTGRLKVRGENGAVATLDLVDGAFAAASLDDHVQEPTELLREVLRWKKGSFRFRSTNVKAPSGDRRSMSELLLEAMRREDEARRG